MSQTRILVGRRYSSLDLTWSEHQGQTFDEVVAKMTAKAREGKANSQGFEVIQVEVTRMVRVQPVITAAEVTEVSVNPEVETK